jgi:peptidoglycan/LPS O-acetylase OafA/YrhL
MVKSNKIHLLLLILIGFVFCEERFNWLSLTPLQYKPDNRHSLKPRIVIFLSGSLMATMFYLIDKKHAHIGDFFKHRYIQIVLKILAILAIFNFVYFFIPHINSGLSLYSHSNLCGIFWSYFLFILLNISDQNFFIIKCFTESIVFKSCGKYSFGIYLFHPMCIKLLEFSVKTKTVFEKLVLIMLLSYLVGFLFFYLIENPLINVANLLCKKISLNRKGNSNNVNI